VDEYVTSPGMPSHDRPRPFAAIVFNEIGPLEWDYAIRMNQTVHNYDMWQQQQVRNATPCT
jgi:hypothetical protein